MAVDNPQCLGVLNGGFLDVDAGYVWDSISHAGQSNSPFWANQFSGETMWNAKGLSCKQSDYYIGGL